jgi:hypothetical protein
MWATAAFMASFLALVFNHTDKVTRFTVGVAFILVAALIIWCACDAWTGDEWYIELLTGRFLGRRFTRLIRGRTSEDQDDETSLMMA